MDFLEEAMEAFVTKEEAADVAKFQFGDKPTMKLTLANIYLSQQIPIGIHITIQALYHQYTTKNKHHNVNPDAISELLIFASTES
jgi:hypothetical protein